MKHNLQQKNLQRMSALVVSFMLLCSICMFASAADYPLVNDKASLLTQEEVDALEEKAEEYSDQWNQDIAIYTVNTLEGKEIMAAADDYFDYNGFGRGSDRSGVVFLIDMGGREMWLSTRGESITALTDYGIEYILDEVFDDIADGYYADAFDTYLDTVAELYQLAADGTPYDVGSHVHGSQGDTYVEPDPPTMREALEESFPPMLMGCGIVALVFCVICMLQLRTAVRQQSARAYINWANVHTQHDYYLYSNTTRRRIERDSGSSSRGGSSTHRSSSGARHGGGGRRF